MIELPTTTGCFIFTFDFIQEKKIAVMPKNTEIKKWDGIK